MSVAKSSSIFICYSHEDNESTDKSKRWLDRLIQHLKPLIDQGDLAVFSDKDINIGEDWHGRIQTQLSGAKAAVVLVSPAFLASEYIANSEMPVLLKKASNGGLKILPIHISPSNYATKRFKYPDPRKGPDEFTLASIQAAHSPSKTMGEMTEAEQNRVFVQLSDLVLKIVQNSPLELKKDEQNKRGDKQLHSKLVSMQETSSPKDSINLLTIEQNIKSIHVNRDEEIAKFCDMIGGSGDLHILFIEASSGMGKSALLKQFLEMSKREKLLQAMVDFKKPSYRFGEILGEMCYQFGEDFFSIFHNQCRNFIANSGLTVGHTALLTSSIDAALAKLSPDQRKIDRQVITDAFFSDLASLHDRFQRPIVILFDTFERASSDVKDWMTEQFIIRIRRYSWIICVVSGQQTPRIDIDADWCIYSKLEHLNKKDIRKYLQRVKLISEDLITFITLHSKGHPSTLQQLALTLSTMER